MHAPSLWLALALIITGCEDAATSAGTPAADQVARRAGFGAKAQYDVTITNLTSGQPLTPPLIVTHHGSDMLFRPGRPASDALQQLAENGNLDPELEALGKHPRASDVTVAASAPIPPLLPGQSVTVRIDAEAGARWISFASMLICTNDGFTGVPGAPLPIDPAKDLVKYVNAWDAGTETNTEDFDDLVSACPALTNIQTNKPGTDQTNPDLAEHGMIHPHAGISGKSDLDPAIHGWTDPVARFAVHRVPATSAGP